MSRSKEIMGPEESEEMFLDFISDNGGIIFQDALDFAKRKDIWLGLETSILDVLATNQALGFIEFDEKTGKYIRP